MPYKLFRNINEIVTMSGAAQKQGRKVQEADLSIIKKAAILVNNGIIEWIGAEKNIPKKIKAKEIDLKKQNVFPGFVECHTHLVFAGSRAEEFEMRNSGMSYQEISAKGGGIKSTMNAVRKISKSELQKVSQARVQEFVKQGVTTLEVKSGYGLDLKNEIKCLEVAKNLKNVSSIPTFLGAHALPPEFRSTEEYLNFLAEKVLPVVKKKKLSKRADIFIEKGFFEAEASQKYLHLAKEMGFEITIHADQITLSGGSLVGINLDALSVDHVIQADEKVISLLAQSNTTAVLLPAADLYMKCAYPKARMMIDKGCRVALATDFNPGTSPTQDINLVGLLARLEMKMTMPEVFAAYTVGASHALNLQDQIGSLEVGKSADFFSTSMNVTDFFYSAGAKNPLKVFLKGQELK